MPQYENEDQKEHTHIKRPLGVPVGNGARLSRYWETHIDKWYILVWDFSMPLHQSKPPLTGGDSSRVRVTSTVVPRCTPAVYNHNFIDLSLMLTV